VWKEYCSRLKEKVQLLDAFKQATVKMKNVIDSKDIPRMALHVKERQRIIDRIERIDREVNQFVQGDSFSIEKLCNKAKDVVRSHLDQMKTTLASLADVDKECLALAQAQHEALKSDILKVRLGLRVTKSYRGTCHQGARFLDMKR
jgi:hypothetical protein